MTKANDTTYHSKRFKVVNTEYEILVASGKRNYINITSMQARKVFGTPGKDFKNIDEALSNYKSMKMKAALIQVYKLIENEIKGA